MKIINIDISDKIEIKNIEDTKSGKINILKSTLMLPTGNYNNVLLNFNFIGLTPDENINLLTNFSLSHNKKVIEVALSTIKINNKEYKYACYVPAEIFEKPCTVTLGLYGFLLNENGELEKRISLVPTTGVVVKGSYDPNATGTIIPAPTVFEVYFDNVAKVNAQMANNLADYEKKLDDSYNDYSSAINKQFTEANKNLEEYNENVETLYNNANQALKKIKHFNSVDEMKADNTLVAGYVVKTLGYYASNDGGGATYLVRTKKETDDIDDISIIECSDSLVAELIKSNVNTNKKYVFVGDSYLEGYNPDGNVTSWGNLVKSYLELSDSQVVMSYLGGSSFAGSKPFTNLINKLTNDNTVTDVVICGGFNDRTFNRTQIKTGMVAFKNAVISKFPNAKIHLGFIGWSSNPEYLYSLYNTFINYKWCSNELGIEMFSGCEYSLHNYFNMFSTDKIHPNLTGQESIARNLVNCILNGSCDVKYTYSSIGFVASGDCTEITGSTSNLSTIINNDIVQVSSQGRIIFNINNISYTASGTLDIEVATLTNGHIIGNNYKINSIPVQLIIHGDSKYYNATGIIIFRNGKMYISFALVNNENNNYQDFVSLDEIQMLAFSGCLDTMFC